jgi:hypothetical protein
MRRFLPFFWALVVVVVLPAARIESLAQTVAVQQGPSIVKLTPPLYPPLARQAAIKGDVDIVLAIRVDGSVESAVVASGPPLLKQAALDSVQQSHYECSGCSQSVTPYQLVYTFQLIGLESCCTPTSGSADNNHQQGQPYPRVTQSENHVTVVDQYVCICDPAATIRKARSVKCLYLWRCGSR